MHLWLVPPLTYASIRHGPLVVENKAGASAERSALEAEAGGRVVVQYAVEMTVPTPTESAAGALLLQQRRA
ncbi:MAG: hypothetical protein M9929_05805 [Burkholderiaceae bacterium]|nr:hypothetical protein [Burkholderiaceae bacterium]